MEDGDLAEEREREAEAELFLDEGLDLGLALDLVLDLALGFDFDLEVEETFGRGEAAVVAAGRRRPVRRQSERMSLVGMR